ncbi:hypothetical protein [Rhizobium leguminosarum]|uniref:hypothetical protein n=1 Tax=Rhizobium leguminosarum TaxID=384 RepID=UPI001C91F453|nr:hypothetical protein [Rhizobium leguminosarum]MBY2932517.1 hypothetical protein [Rhizobium leguminosarum]
MPRNPSTGVYSKPAGTTPSVGQVIDPVPWNALTTDLGNEITNSLPRDGSAPMVAPLKAASGTVSAPGIGFASVPQTGLYLKGGGLLGFTQNGVDVAFDPSLVYAAKSADYLAVAADNNAVHRYTAAATLTLTAAATLGVNWHYTVIADGADVTIDPDGAETINGAPTLIIPNNKAAWLVCSGSAFYAIVVDRFASAPKGHINGLVLVNTPGPGDTTNDIDIAAGEAASDGTIPYLMVLASALTKRLDATWAVGTNQGGLDTGSVGNNTYYVWEIQRSDNGVLDALLSLSSTAPTMPANYDRKRVIGQFARVGGVNSVPRSYSQVGATPWVAYTPTFNGVGTVTGLVCRSRRVGSNLEVEVTFTTGVATATIFDMTLGFNGVSGGIVCDTFWNSNRPLVGVGVLNVAGATSLYVLGLGGSGLVNISFASAGRDGFAPVPANAIGSASVVGLRFSVPIQGWN